MKKSNLLPAIIAVAMCFGLTAGATGVPVYTNIGTPIANSDAKVLVASGGDVTVTYLVAGNPGYEDILYYNGTVIFDNKTSTQGSTYDLGNIAAGTVMNFTLQVVETGRTYAMGSGANNSDGTVHAYVVDGWPSTGTAYVGFEDLANGISDYNYADMNFTFTSVTAAAVPEPSTFALLGLAGIAGLIARRRKQKA